MSERDVFPIGWSPPRGYSHGVVASGRLVVLAGQIGWNPETLTFESNDFVAQVAQALRNIDTLLKTAGGLPEHLVRLTWFITDRVAYLTRQKEIGTVYREVLGANYPPMSVVFVSGLVEERAKVEIEAMAVLPVA